MKKLEIEKKFLINLPSSWDKISSIFSNLIEIEDITQTYLKSKSNLPHPRVRKSKLKFADKIKYTFNVKQNVSDSKNAANEETEFEISEKEYKELLENALEENFSLRKTRFVFCYKDQTFELDLFKDDLEGLAILEIELKDPDSKVDFPPFIEIKKEVSKIKEMNNFYLSKKKDNYYLNLVNK